MSRLYDKKIRNAYKIDIRLLLLSLGCTENNGVAIFVCLNNIIPARNSSSGTDVFTGVWGGGYGITPELQKRSVRILLECFLVFVIISLRKGDYLLALTEWGKMWSKIAYGQRYSQSHQIACRRTERPLETVL